MRRVPLVVVTAVLAVLALGPAPASASTYQEPRLRPPAYGTGIHGDGTRNFADPSIIRAHGGGRFFAFSTHQTGSAARRIMVMSSDNLWDWSASGHGAPNEALASTPGWARPLSQGGAFWAPSVVRAAGRYVLYFAAKHRNVPADRPGWCIGIATSAALNQQFEPRDTPLFCRVNSTSTTPASFSGSPQVNKGAIDPQVFRAPNGNLFLHFKALDNLRQLWGVRLTDTGLGLSGPGHGLVALESQARTWEYSSRLHFTVLENPSMVFNPTPGVERPYLLLYAGGEWQIPSNYGTGYAACRSPLSGCTRFTSDRPWLRTRGESAGPGGASTFTGPDGTPWIAYHTYRAGHVLDGSGRRLHVEPLRFARVHPRLNNRKPTGTITGSSPSSQTVHLEGTADDPDTGRPVSLSIREGGVQFAEATTGSAGNWSIPTFAATPGLHTYCARARDDNGLAPRVIGCVDVTVRP
ncbi:MAG TPA: family 43 glycosylhydrolase [Acidimicrobiales bacterium]|nr:family 43 glycosylhydrolase [Acidimicrobiales bacterium]